MQLLEGREVPAALSLVWTSTYNVSLGQNSDFYDVDNWSTVDEYGDYQPSPRGPFEGDSLFFIEPGTVNCDGFGPLYADPNNSGGDGKGEEPPPASPPPPYQLGTLEIGRGYTARVDLRHPVTVGHFILTSGEIEQTPFSTGPSPTISVAGQFTWSGSGVLNDSASPAAVSMLPGASEAVDPAAGLTTGSTLSFTGAEVNGAEVGSEGVVKPGTVTFKNGAGVNVGNFCNVQLGEPVNPARPSSTTRTATSRTYRRARS